MVLGIGSGHPVTAKRFFDFDLSSPLDAVSDYLQIVGELRHGRRVTHHGKVFSVEGARLGLLPSGPLWTVVGAMGPRMLELAVREADGVLLNWCTGIPPAVHGRAGFANSTVVHLFSISRPTCGWRFHRTGLRLAGRSPKIWRTMCGLAPTVGMWRTRDWIPATFPEPRRNLGSPVTRRSAGLPWSPTALRDWTN